MNLQSRIEKRQLQKVEVNEAVLADLLRAVDRDFKDAQIEGLSNDRRFATAYAAALGLANYFIRKQGYRVAAKFGHHSIAFEVLQDFLGEPIHTLADYFNKCRRKRNQIYYRSAGCIADSEASEILTKVVQFKELLLQQEDSK